MDGWICISCECLLPVWRRYADEIGGSIHMCLRFSQMMHR